MISIRQAVPSDVLRIAEIHEYCWRETYHFMPSEVLDNRDAKYREAQWEKWFADKPEGENLYIIKAGWKTVGFCCCKPCDDQDAPKHSGELHAAYTLPEYRGGVIGPLVIVEMGKFLLGEGYESLIIWAFKENQARIWYGQIGFQEFIRRDRIIAGHGVPEIGYVCNDTDVLMTRLSRQLSRLQLTSSPRNRQQHPYPVYSLRPQKKIARDNNHRETQKLPQSLLA